MCSGKANAHMQCCSCLTPMPQLVGTSRQWLWGKAGMSTEVLLPVCVTEWAPVGCGAQGRLHRALVGPDSVWQCGFGCEAEHQVQTQGFFLFTIILLHTTSSWMAKAIPNTSAHPLPPDNVGNPVSLSQKWEYHQPDEALTQAAWPGSSLLWEQCGSCSAWALGFTGWAVHLDPVHLSFKEGNLRSLSPISPVTPSYVNTLAAVNSSPFLLFET